MTGSVSFKRVLTFGALVVTVSFFIILLNQSIQLVALADRIDPVFGTFVLICILLLFAAVLVVPAVLYFRLPARQPEPPEREGKAYNAYMDQLKKRLSHNHYLQGKPLDSPKDVDAAVAHLDRIADERAKEAAKIVFISTAISQNGRLDGLVVLAVNIRLVWNLAHVYLQRPSIADLITIYKNVIVTAFVVGSIEELDISEQIEPVIGNMAGSVIGAVPGAQAVAVVLTNSLFSGSMNAFLTLRIGMIAKRYSNPVIGGNRRSLRRSAIMEASRMLGSIVVECSGKVAGGFAGALRKKGVGVVKGAGSRLYNVGAGFFSWFIPGSREAVRLEEIIGEVAAIESRSAKIDYLRKARANEKNAKIVAAIDEMIAQV